MSEEEPKVYTTAYGAKYTMHTSMWTGKKWLIDGQSWRKVPLEEFTGEIEFTVEVDE